MYTERNSKFGFSSALRGRSPQKIAKVEGRTSYKKESC